MADEVQNTPAPVETPPPAPVADDKEPKPVAKTEPATAPAKPTTKDIANFAQRRNGLKAKAERVAAREKELEAKGTAWTQERQEMQTQLAELKKQIAEISSGNPLLREGNDPDKLIREFIAKGTPEERQLALEKQVKEERAARERLEKQWAEERAKEKKDADDRATKAAQEYETQALNRFTSWATNAERAKAYPYTNAEFEAPQIAAFAKAIHEQGKTARWRDPQTGEMRTGAQYSFDEVARAIETHAKSEYEKRQERRKALLGSPVEPPVTEPRVTSSPRQVTCPRT